LLNSFSCDHNDVGIVDVGLSLEVTQDESEHVYYYYPVC